ncbi:hypothetical protein K8O93_01265 [Gordonia bronchialis]|uniref:hypothetical protein n=1 Tax=Gordonia bronchialis TaxID=2054 RepID=UPI001CBD8CAE|nr:hypothetical protein [Gordonia bronchialis]UAK38464.1 hypothetical protein K8O93_01265 [Gordonia bronchialis]
MTARRFGRRVQHDPRSRAYGVVASSVAPLRSVTWETHAPVLDQHDLGACVGFTMAQWVNVTRSQMDADGPWLTADDAISIYSRATEIDQFEGAYPPDDTGTAGLAAAQVAVERGLIRLYRHAFGLQQTLVAIQSGPAMIGTIWLEGMNEPDSAGFLRPTGAELGGHEYLLVGCNIEQRFVTIQNSWSDSWGENGRAHITFDDLDALLENQGDVTVLIA